MALGFYFFPANAPQDWQENFVKATWTHVKRIRTRVSPPSSAVTCHPQRTSVALNVAHVLQVTLETASSAQVCKEHMQIVGSKPLREDFVSGLVCEINFPKKQIFSM